MAENIDTLLKESRLYHPTAQTKAAAHIQDYESAYKKSIADPEGFWSDVAKELVWFSPWTKVLEWNYPWAKWFVGATCNIAYNCLDRHVKTWRKNKVAIIWVGENDQERVITYGELYRQVNRCANALKTLGLKKETESQSTFQKFPNRSSLCSPAHASASFIVWSIQASAPRPSQAVFRMPNASWSLRPTSGLTEERSSI